MGELVKRSVGEGDLWPGELHGEGSVGELGVSRRASLGGGSVARRGGVRGRAGGGGLWPVELHGEGCVGEEMVPVKSRHIFSSVTRFCAYIH